jgi:hypothetical protein
MTDCIGVRGRALLREHAVTDQTLPHVLTERDEYRTILWFVLLPFATYAPVLLLWLRPWQRNRKERDFIPRTKDDRELQDQLRAASLYAENMRSRNAH